MMLDLDHFKAVNDNYGHSIGDKTLKHFAKILMDFSVENETLVGRWGGEEFIIVCRGKNAAEALEMAESLREKVAADLFPDICQITCSIGVTELKKEDTFLEAFNRIDKAVYESKDKGRNVVTLL